MPFNRERATGQALLTLASSAAMEKFKGEIRALEPHEAMAAPTLSVPRQAGWVPNRVVVLDGSTVTAPLRLGLPGADASLLKVSIVRIDLKELNSIPANEIPSPSVFRDMDSVSTFDAVLPGANVIRRGVPGD